jgi:hypothetical protein
MANKNIPSLDGLIQTKGASRPDAMTQRGDSPARDMQANLQAAVSAPTPVAPAAPPVPVAQPVTQTHTASQPAPASREPRAKSLTLRLSETQYERLRRYAFETRLSHQDIIEGALMGVLDQQQHST